MAGIWDAVNNNLLNPEKPNAPGVVSDVRRALGQTAAGVGSTLRDVGLEDTGGSLESYGAGVVRRNPSEIQSFEDVLSRPFTTAREAVGEVIPQVGLAVGGQLVGRTVGGFLGAPLGPLGIIAGQQVGGLVGGLAPIVAQTYGGIRSEQREAGIDDRPRALGATIPAAALERFGGAERIAGKIAGQGTQFLARESGESLWKALGKQAIRGGVEETITEIPQTALERYGAYKSLTDQEAIDEYGVAGAKAFLGGGAIRAGLSAFAGTRQDQGEFDLTQPEAAPPVVKAPTGIDVAPVVAATQPTAPASLDQETDLMAPSEAITPTVTPAATAAAPTDITTPAEAEVTAPSIFSKTDEALNELNIKPTKKSRNIYDYMVSKGIDPASEEAEPILNALSESKYKFATDTIGAIIRARSPRGAAVSTVQEPAGGLGVGGAVVPGTVGAAGSDVALQGGMGGSPATAGALLGQAGVLPSAAAQPPAAVVPPTPLKPNTTLRLFQQEALPDQEAAVDDYVEIARATGNTGGINATLADVAGKRQDQKNFTKVELDEVIESQLADSKSKDRDRKIIKAYITARRAVPNGDRVKMQKEIGATFGVDASRVRQIGNPEKLANVAVAMGFDRNQVFTELGIQSTKEAAVDLSQANEAVGADGIVESDNQEISDMDQSGVDALTDDSREWQKASTAGSQMAVRLVSLADKIAELQAAANELKQFGLPEAEAAAAKRINDLTASYKELTEKLSKAKAVPKATKKEPQTEAAQKAAEEVDMFKEAAREAEAEKFRAERAAKLAADRKGLEVGDTVMNPKLGTGVVKGFSGDGDATIVTVDFQSGQTKELSVKMAKLEKTNAVQVQSTASVPVQPEAQASQGVGGQVRRAEKPASQGQVAVKGQAKVQVANKGQALWNSLAANTPGLVSYDQLTKLEQDYLTDLAVRTNGKPSVAKEMGLQQLLAKEPVTIDVEARVIDDQTVASVAALPAPQIDRLEKHYGEKRDSAEFLKKVQEDITKYVTEGAQSVAGAIRSIIKALAEGVLAMGIVFNPNITTEAFNFNVAKTFEQTIEVTQPVPEAAKAQMSELAQGVYQAMAPVAMKSGKWFMIADKPNGMLHIFKEDGSHALSDPTLYGKDKGDVLEAVSSLEGGAKVTPAGKFTLRQASSIYAGGVSLQLVESEDPTGIIAIHAADTSTPSENRLERLETPTADDNRVSYGCINTRHATFLDKIKPNISKLDGGMVFVLPDAKEKTAEMFAPEKRTVTRTERDIPAPKNTLFSKTTNAPAANNSVYNIWNTLYKLFDVIPADSAYKDFIRVSQTAQDAYEAAGKKVPLVQLQNAQAFIDPTDDRIVHLIADNIAKGSELAVLLHEVGVHVGLKNKLGANFKILEGQVKSWANASKGSLERQVYERAMARVAAARLDGVITADIAAEELVAYAAEEAALAGVKVKDAPRSRLEAWVKQLHDIASQAFKSFFKINNVPELSVQDLVNFSFAAAQEHMQSYRSEIGATANATESQVAKYYAGARGTYDGTRVVINEDRPGPGEESFFWSPADKFGSFTEIGTRGFYSPATSRRAGPRGVGAPEYAAMVVTSAESRAFGDEQKNNQDKVLLTFQATRDPQTNIWSLIVSGPDIDSALYVDLYVEGLATTTKDNEGNEWSRLEGISGRDNLRLLGEFRRRLTRMKDGEIPNIDFVRVTGSGAAKEDGRPGVYAADTLATRFSKAPTADQVISALPKPLQKAAREQWTNISTLAKRGLYASAITEDVIGMAKKYMPAAAKYLQAQYDRQGTRLEFEKRIEDILSAFEKLPENLKGVGKGSVNEYIQDSTLQKKWGYYPGEQQIGTTLFETDPDLEERFKAFPPAAQNVIKAVFRHGYEALKLKQRAAEAAVNREFAAREKAAGNDLDLLQSLAKEKAQMLRRMTRARNVDVSNPYAYLGRYGDYVVIAKSKEFIAYEEAAKGTEARVGADSITGDAQQAKNWLQDNVSNPVHYVVQFAETQGEADSIAEELQATGQYDIQPEDAGIKEANASYAGGSDVHMAVARLRNLANRQSDSTDGKLDKAISDLYLMTVAEASARRSELERKNVSGADKNMMRNLATSGRADAHFLANMEHGDAINDALEAMRNQARNNRREAMPLYNELYTRYADSMEYSQPGVLAQNMLRMSTLWHLSTSPAYYLQQALQTSVLSLPYMAGRLGYARSASAIKRAYSDMSDLVAGLGVSDRIDFDKAPADVRFMLKELVRMGKIDIGVDADATSRIDDKGPLGKAMFKLQNVNARIEAINRATAAIAAYRGYVDLYKDAPGADGVRFAADVVSNSHGNYDGFNTPRILESGGAKVLLQFKRFQIIQLSMLAKLIHTSFKGASAEERAIARASLKYITAHMAVLGGALGVPFVSQAASILSGVFGDEDEPDDYEYKLRRMIGDGAVADLLLRGVPAAVGLESIGKRLSMENVASPFGPFVEFNLTSRADAAQMIVGMMGPSVGLGLKFVDALGMMSKGEYYKGLELALPNGIANAMKGYRFASEGVTMRSGDLVLKPEDVSIVDAAFQAVGLPTTTITDRQYTQKVVAEFDKFYSERAGEIKRSYLKASRQSDPAAMAEARNDWQKLQDSRVKNGYKRQPMSELFRVPTEARKRELGVVGGVETTKSNRRFVEQVGSVS